jgi:hypothetical protein
VDSENTEVSALLCWIRIFKNKLCSKYISHLAERPFYCHVAYNWRSFPSCYHLLMFSEFNMFILKLTNLVELDMKVSGQDTAALWGHMQTCAHELWHIFCWSVSAYWLLPALPIYGFRWVSVNYSFLMEDFVLLIRLPAVCCVKWLNKQTEKIPNHRAITVTWIEMTVSHFYPHLVV